MSTKLPGRMGTRKAYRKSNSDARTTARRLGVGYDSPRRLGPGGGYHFTGRFKLQKGGRDESLGACSMNPTLLRGFELYFPSRQRFARGSRKRHWE